MAYLAQIVREQKLNVWECSACRIPIVLTVDHEEQLRTYGGSFYCPAGHEQSWHETELTRLRAKLTEQTRTATEMAATANAMLNRARAAEAAERQVSDEMKRLKTRAKAGVCPCCNRTFKQLAAHMKNKHPDAKP